MPLLAHELQKSCVVSVFIRAFPFLGQLAHSTEGRVPLEFRVPPQHPKLSHRRREFEVTQGSRECFPIIDQRSLDELALVTIRLFLAQSDRQHLVRI
jgi:hypothetical protein